MHSQARGVAQSASVLAWGASGRQFESDHSDKNVCNQLIYRRFLFVVENVVELIHLITLRFNKILIKKKH